jgi:PIN domain nuclease of toxin-antitoxin system
MRLLVDTHILLWAISEPHSLSSASHRQLEAPENGVLFSAASIWELALKLQTGRLALAVELDALIQAAKTIGFEELPVNAIHAAGVRSLPLYHRDPFDRLLVAQAILEPARL